MTVPAAALPPLGPPRAFAPPPYTDAVLDTGLRLVTVRAGTVPLAEIRMLAPLPAHAVDPAAADVLATLTAQECARRVTAGVDADPRREGTLVSVAWTGTWLALNASVPAPAAPWALRLLARALSRPRLTEEACAVAARALALRAPGRLAHPRTAAHAALYAHAYPGCRERHPGPDALLAVTVAEVRALHTAHVHPRGAYAVVVAPGELAEEAARAYALWTGTGLRSAAPPPAPPPAGHGIRAVPWGAATTTAQVLLAASAPDRTDPSFPALSLANCLFGGYFSSRLMRELREREGLAYHIESTIDDSFPRPSILISYATAPENVTRSLHAVKRELWELASRPPGAAEIDAARAHMTGLTWIGQTSQSGLASAYAGVLGHGLDPGWLTTFPELLREVTPAQVVEAAAAHYGPHRFIGATLGAPPGEWAERAPV
ncbi:M16 family metallopeptidase [Streptomyces sp. NPDC058374]|uniref:M16 family metallopeptidase n=1 Tax=Streptomyces sp. NPDC058374 TaxID=3346466 RepID=UPI00364D79A5